MEVLGIEQSRSWRTASLNEFRVFFGLVKHEKFEDINPDPRIARSLRQLYDHPDNVELYPGVIIEGAKKEMTPGSGLCPPQTIGKAILSDAVALIRGDRFYTVVCTSYSWLTLGLYARSFDSFRICFSCLRPRSSSRWRRV